MALVRKLIGKPCQYEGRTITVRFMGPDYLCFVNEIEMSAFYASPEAALAGDRRHVDEEIKAANRRAQT